ncbi:hypothetical protein D9M72_249120 [compost metagenome]
MVMAPTESGPGPLASPHRADYREMCSSGASGAVRQEAVALGLPLHGTMQPTAIPEFFVRFLTEPGDRVIEPFRGTVRTGLGAGRIGRRRLVSEWILQYIRRAAELFREAAGFHLHPALHWANQPR